MAKFIGKKLKIEIFGESHSAAIGAKVDGFPALCVNGEALCEFMARRKASASVFSTKRTEPDLPEWTGMTDGKIDGSFSFEIKNTNTRSGDYSDLFGKPRPSHADYAWHAKDGVLDFSGGGRFSGRLTAPLVVIGGLAKQKLESLGISVQAYVAQVGGVKGRSYKDGAITAGEVPKLREGDFPSLDKKEEMIAEIAGICQESDSVGGAIECIVSGLPAGIGDNLFEGLEGKIASLVYAVPGVKGVEFGAGFDLAAMRGSVANDPLRYNGDKVVFASNNAGGINGGISNGNELTLAVAMRPTPSIAKQQDTVDLVNKQNTKISVHGRHDACIVPRAVPCIESAVAIAILDEII